MFFEKINTILERLKNKAVIENNEFKREGSQKEHFKEAMSNARRIMKRE